MAGCACECLALAGGGAYRCTNRHFRCWELGQRASPCRRGLPGVGHRPAVSLLSGAFLPNLNRLFLRNRGLGYWASKGWGAWVEQCWPAGGPAGASAASADDGPRGCLCARGAWHGMERKQTFAGRRRRVTVAWLREIRPNKNQMFLSWGWFYQRIFLCKGSSAGRNEVEECFLGVLLNPWRCAALWAARCCPAGLARCVQHVVPGPEGAAGQLLLLCPVCHQP